MRAITREGTVIFATPVVQETSVSESVVSGTHGRSFHSFSKGAVLCAFDRANDRTTVTLHVTPELTPSILPVILFSTFVSC